MGIPKEEFSSEILTEDEFDKRFTLVEFEDGDNTTDDLLVMQQYPQSQVWSLVDDGDGGSCLVSGFACVNFIAWQVTEEKHPGGYCDVIVEMPELDLEDEEDDDTIDKALFHEEPEDERRNPDRLDR